MTGAKSELHGAPSTAEAGVDGWVSSSVHADSETAESAAQQRAVYARWAPTYEAEMEANGLCSYKSVTAAVCDILARAPRAPATLRVLDAGCGTGLLGSFLARTLAPRHVAITGADLSPDMLDEARAKGCYEALVAVDLNEDCGTALASAGLFDFVVGSGLFMPGHCAVHAFGRLLRFVARDGHAVFTIRESLYAKDKVGYVGAVEAEGCRLISDSVLPYYGEIAAHVIVVHKVA